jgi:GNAT superfamily N-acetyltransferase
MEPAAVNTRSIDPPFSIRKLDGGRAADVADLQNILCGAPGYALLVEGRPPPVDAATELIQELPAGKGAKDKFVFAFDCNGEPIGCVDLVRGYPGPEIAYLGLLLFIESAQGCGFGPWALCFVEETITSWGCTKLRLAVIETNRRALAFWAREGFIEIHRRVLPGYTGKAIVMERAARSRGLTV